jgi:type I restriction enzyme, R subunit
MTSSFSPHDALRFNEKYLSQIPALQLLINLGYTYLTPEQALRERQGKASNVLLESILREQLKKINRIRYKGGEYLFSEENLQSAIQKLKNVRYEGLLRTNETTYDLLTLGTSETQVIEGDSKSFNLDYIDWRNPERNVFHVTAEYCVEQTRSHETLRPDVVLFVNGIPLAVIECKSPKIEVAQAVSQCVRNQNDAYIPKLFTFTQILLAVNRNEGLYATTGTGEKYWAVWQELGDKDEVIAKAVHSPISATVKNALFSGDFAPARRHFDALEAGEPRLVTEQDKLLHSLCRPARLLELAHKFTVFDNGIKKIARYQQYFVVLASMERLRHREDGSADKGRRKGGIVWQTQGSGKSLTMVMLARCLVFDPEIRNPRIVLVTDREDLDIQLKNTFEACGMEPEQASSGRHLLTLLTEDKATIVTTLVHKFENAVGSRGQKLESSDIFALVDESHRSNFGSLAARMRQLLPNACYIGFTGTPLMKKDKNNFNKFGGLIEPHYSIRQAVKDGAVVPLLYEGRHAEMRQDKAAIDMWFERHTQGLSDAQKTDLKRKYARAEALSKADRIVYMRAFDISEHFRENWKGTGFKAQLVAPDKATAVKYHQYLGDIGHVTSEVVISAPDSRDGWEETDQEEPTEEVLKFWQRTMKRYGNNEEEYLKQTLARFRAPGDPEILVVVHKLLTGFDAPRNTVIYLCKTLREHTLLQAIARVNRVHDKKDFGYVVDYMGLLGELDKALTMYGPLEGFDEEDLEGALFPVQEEIRRLPQRHADLWDIFKEVKNSRDEEAYERLLADPALRDTFYQRLTIFGKTLGIALASEAFISDTDEKKIQRYKNDLRRFEGMRISVKQRYAETIDYRDYEPKIQKLLDTHIQSDEVIRLNDPVDILDDKAFSLVKEKQGVYETKTDASRADTIAHATKKVITEKMDEDPAFYQKFSDMIQQVIEAFRAQRLSDLEYLNKVTDISERVVNRVHEGIPERIVGNEDAMAYFGVIKPVIVRYLLDENEADALSAEAALAVQGILDSHRKVNFWEDADAQKKAANAIDDYLFDEIRGRRELDISPESMDAIIGNALQVAKRRSGR